MNKELKNQILTCLEQENYEEIKFLISKNPSSSGTISYMDKTPKILAKERVMWLLILMISAMVTGTILQQYEHAFAVFPMLVTFIPMLTDTGGNAGSQSSTTIIRGMALNQIHFGDFLQVFWKELQVSLLVGTALSIANFIRLVIMYPDMPLVALTVVLSLFFTVVLAKTIGSMLPIIAKYFGLDPAIMAAPLITTIVDALSLITYFALASRILGI